MRYPPRAFRLLGCLLLAGQATTKPQLCTIRQVASRAACEGR
jgi:hypothetical protein